MSYNSSSHNGSSPSPVETFFVLLLSLIIFLTVVGNLLVILAALFTPQLHNATGVFITSLACADLIVGCVVQPLALSMLLRGEWTLGRTACDLWMSVDVLCVTASIHTMCGIALERYMAITRPLRHTVLLGKRRARLGVVVLWTCSALMSFVPIMGHKVDGSSEKCSGNSTCCEFNITLWYGITSSVVSFYVPLLVMLYLYGRVFVIARRQVKLIRKHSLRFLRDSEDLVATGLSLASASNKSSHGRLPPACHVVRQHRALKTLGLVMGVFTICWLPFFVANIVKAMEPSMLSERVFKLLNWLGYANSGLNPIIYCHSAEYRTAFRSPLTHIRLKSLTVWKQLRFWCRCDRLGHRIHSHCTGAAITEQE